MKGKIIMINNKTAGKQRNQFAKLAQYEAYLYSEERSLNTIAKYNRDLQAFFKFLGEKEMTKENLMQWKENLVKKYASTSVNSMLAAVNGFLDWMGMPQNKVKPIKIQKAVFAKPEKELTQQEYRRLVEAAERESNRRLSLLLQTICATGIRVSELKFITKEVLSTGRAGVNCKGKNRIVFLSHELCISLRKFCREQQIENGVIFRTGTGNPIDRSNIWKMMKKLCKIANVEPEKVFPHNLRHLFAKTYYSLEKDLARLADLLGHSNIATTRIYTMESGEEHVKQLERMNLIVIP